MLLYIITFSYFLFAIYSLQEAFLEQWLIEKPGEHVLRGHSRSWVFFFSLRHC